MAMYLKTITAGPMTKQVLYTAPSGRDSETVKREKRKVSSAAKKRANLRTARDKLEMLVAANFGPGDLFVTLTFDEDRLPKDRRAAMRQGKAYLTALRARRLEKPLKYIYAVEHKHGEGRWHIHMLLNNVGESYEELAGLWKRGLVDLKPIKIDRENSYRALAEYMTKEDNREKVGQRLWSCSLNLKKPESETRRVPNDTHLKPPRGAVILDSDHDGNVYGRYEYVKYLSAWPQRAAETKARRRRRK